MLNGKLIPAGDGWFGWSSGVVGVHSVSLDSNGDAVIALSGKSLGKSLLMSEDDQLGRHTAMVDTVAKKTALIVNDELYVVGPLTYVFNYYGAIFHRLSGKQAGKSPRRGQHWTKGGKWHTKAKYLGFELPAGVTDPIAVWLAAGGPSDLQVLMDRLEELGAGDPVSIERIRQLR
jgi:hypothetical protein